MNKYDAVDEYAIKVILWNNDQHGTLGFENLNCEYEDLWLLSVIRNACGFRQMKIYYKGNFINYLYLKYKKKFKFLRYYTGQKDIFMIDATKFENEMASAVEEDYCFLQKIYLEYYRR